MRIELGDAPAGKEHIEASSEIIEAASKEKPTSSDSPQKNKKDVAQPSLKTPTEQISLSEKSSIPSKNVSKSESTTSPYGTTSSETASLGSREERRVSCS